MLVIAVEQAVAAPFASRQLADLGARVIKIERPGGRRLRARLRPHGEGPGQPLRLDQPVEGVADARSQAAGGGRVLRRLLARADVFVHNLAPGAMERLGFALSGAARAVSAARDLRDLRIRHRRTLSRQEGVRPAGAERGGTGLDYRHARGALEGRASRSPTLPPACTRSRASSRRCCAAREPASGAVLDVSMFDALAEWMGFPPYYTAMAAAAAAHRRRARGHRAVQPVHRRRRQSRLSGLQNEREWARFCPEVLEASRRLPTDPRFSAECGRVAAPRELDALITAAFAAPPADGGACASGRRADRQRANEYGAGVPRAPAARRTRPLAEVESPAGPIRALLPPFGMGMPSRGWDPFPPSANTPMRSSSGFGLRLPRRRRDSGVGGRWAW